MKTTPRLFLDEPLAEAREISLPRQQSHYLVDVLRLRNGDPVRVFNSRDGEWLAYLVSTSKKTIALRCERHIASASLPPDIDFLFAPLKHARLDYAVEKATELGARRLRPVITERTIVNRVNLERMRANAIEAAEQCNLVSVPEVLEPQPLERALAGWEQGRALIYCDETASSANPLAALAKLKIPAAVLIGPEGGFTENEKTMLKSCAFVTPIFLGPRILRADTAAVAALTLVQAAIGDWA